MITNVDKKEALAEWPINLTSQIRLHHEQKTGQI